MGAIGNKPKKYRTEVTYDEPEMLADLDSIRKQAKEEGYLSDHKLDVERFINEKYQDIIIQKVTLPLDVSGKLEYKDGVWLMSVNEKHPEVRQRYTLGHELGHYLNHRDSMTSFKDTVYFRSRQKSSMEYTADLFAACLLMPEEDVKEVVNGGAKTVKEMSQKFGVSLEAMKYRLEQLGYGIKKSE